MFDYKLVSGTLPREGEDIQQHMTALAGDGYTLQSTDTTVVDDGVYYTATMVKVLDKPAERGGIGMRGGPNRKTGNVDSNAAAKQGST